MFLVCKQDFDLVLIIDKNIEDLIETNIRQRGIGNPNPIKLGRCIKELERIYGVRKGSAGQSEPKLSGGDVLYQLDIAEMIGISVDTLRKSFPFQQLNRIIMKVLVLMKEQHVTTKNSQN